MEASDPHYSIDYLPFYVSPTVPRYTSGGIGGLCRNERLYFTLTLLSMSETSWIASPKWSCLMLSGTLSIMRGEPDNHADLDDQIVPTSLLSKTA